jgi:2'-5' RNA ligase
MPRNGCGCEGKDNKFCFDALSSVIFNFMVGKVKSKRMTKRLFIAIKILPDIKFQEVYQSLRANLSDEKINWVEMENVHITMKFFGDTEEGKIADITHTIHHAVEQVPAFDVELHHLGLFGGYYKPKVIWIGIEPLEPLQKLSATIGVALSRLGYPVPEEPFTPHLTIGRIKFVTNKKYLVQLIEKQKDAFIQKSHIKSIYLFESILRPQGPIYHVVERFDLLK